MTHYRAAWVLPISEPPIRNGWVAVDGGRVVACGPGAGAPAQAEDLGTVAILPGLVNAHTHLELSYLRDRVPPAREFVTWVRGVIAARRGERDPRSATIMRAVEQAIDECMECGTALVGDISNTLVTFEPLTSSRLSGVLFYELIRFNASDAETFVEQACRQLDALPESDVVRTSFAAHAPYSVSGAMLRAIRRVADLDPGAPVSVHLSEAAEEIEFMRDGTGAWRTLLQDVGAWDPDWTPPGRTPVEFLDDCGLLDRRLIAVHGVQMTSSDLRRLAATGATLVTCPRSNGHTGAGEPPIADFYASGVRIAIGTDSLASTPDLNVFAELATLRALAPSVPAARLLESATMHGARALGFDADFGTIETGKRARLLAVETPADVDDVEEYLVGGVRPEEIRWIDA